MIRRISAALAVVLVVGLGLVGFAAGASAAGLAVQQLTLTPTSADATAGPATFQVRAHLVRSSPFLGVSVSAVLQDPPETPQQTLNDYGYQLGQLAQVSGASTDGVFTGTLTLPAGLAGHWSLGILAETGASTQDAWTADQLRAAGLPYQVATTVTKAPTALTNLVGKTVTTVGGNPITQPLYSVSSVVTYKLGVGVGVTWVQLVSASTACGSLPPYLPLSFTQYTNPVRTDQRVSLSNRTVGACTVKLRALNSAGVGPTASVTFI